MKVLIAGDWYSELHEEVAARSLEKLGHDVVRFRWHKYFHDKDALPGTGAQYLRRLQNRFIVGPRVAKLNEELIKLAGRDVPDVIFIYRGTHIWPKTLRILRSVAPNTVLVGYNNDDPFAPGHPRSLWRHFIASIPEYDMLLAYRHANLNDFKRAGARRVELLRSWFVAERNRPIPITSNDVSRFHCDVVFAGHYESDERLACLEKLAKEGVRIRIFGPPLQWEPVIRSVPALWNIPPVELVWGDDYNRALCGAKIALCFLSKRNRDTYTRRCFEIPAARTMMLSEYSSDLGTLFEEGKEAEYFRSPDELVEKVKIYLHDDVRRAAMSEAGYRRVWNDKHEVTDRMNKMMLWVTQIQIERGVAYGSECVTREVSQLAKPRR